MRVNVPVQPLAPCSARGFTLVTVALALLTAGLLIASFLRCSELMREGRITSTIAQFQAYQSAVGHFRDTFKALPGDMPQAASLIHGCNDFNACRNGNGNGQLDPFAGISWHAPPQQTINDEGVQMWKHLSLAGLISDVDATATTQTMGQSLPYTSCRKGAYTAFGSDGTDSGLKGIIIYSTSNAADPARGNFALPTDIRELDQKMDDGKALAGELRCFSTGWSSGCGKPGLGRQGADGYDADPHAAATVAIAYRIYRD